MRPLKNVQFWPSTRKAIILTTGIHLVFRGLKFEPDAVIGQKGALFKGLNMIKRLITTMLILTILVPSVPFHNACDVDWNNRIDLSDVIANMQSMVQSTAGTRDFRAELEKAVTSIRNVAGLNQIIRTDEGSNKAVGGANHVYLVAVIDVMPVMVALSVIGDIPAKYNSIERPAVHGPPRSLT